MGRRQAIVGLAALLLFAAAPQAQESACADGWPAASTFLDRFVSADGRLIDPGTAPRVTTSEGQAYGLFFALVAGDRARFARLLEWTENNLAAGDLRARLPAWQWGRDDVGRWQVLDDNTAADADLWLAYVLGEAGRRWDITRYRELGRALALRVLREETARLPRLGLVLLPGRAGFHPAPGRWRLNPSYVPLQLVTRMATLYPDSGWPDAVEPSLGLLLRSAPRGLAPDWVAYDERHGFRPDPVSERRGSYDAIRVYLWAGMLASDDPARARLVRHFRPMTRHLRRHGAPPLAIDAGTGATRGVGPVGFAAALLPLLAAEPAGAAIERQRRRIERERPLARADNYYDQVLTLFGLGWLEGRYRFDVDGALEIAPGRCPRT